MTFHAVETRCLWLEFAGAAGGDHGLSDPFSFIRLVDSLIEGGEQQELIASLRGGRWVLAADESIHISHISGLGVFSVHMEQMDGCDASLECTKMQVDGTLLLVDGRPVAHFDESRNAWTRIGTDTRLHGIRLEPEVRHCPRASRSGCDEARLVAQHRDKFVLAMGSERFDKGRNNALRSLPRARARVTHA